MVLFLLIAIVKWLRETKMLKVRLMRFAFFYIFIRLLQQLYQTYTTANFKKQIICGSDDNEQFLGVIKLTYFTLKAPENAINLNFPYFCATSGIFLK